MKLTNKDNLPAGLVRAIAADPYDHGGSDITASTLADPPLLQALKRKHWDDLEEDASERVWALLGQAAHVIMDRGAQQTANVLSERRLFMDIDGWKLSGAFDHLSLEDGKLSDLKVTSVWTVIFGDRIQDYAKQLNVLAELVEHNGVATVSSLEIVAILRDWSARDLERSKGDYPKQPVVVIPLKLWGPLKRQAYIEERVRLHQQARELLANGQPELITPCSDEERWMKQDKKTGAKTYTRCEKYCAPAAFCPVVRREKVQA